MGRSGPFMLRIGAIFIVICMVLIAGAVGAVLYLAFGLSGAESTMVVGRGADRDWRSTTP